MPKFRAPDQPRRTHSRALQVPTLALAACLVLTAPALARLFGSDYIPIEAAPQSERYLTGDFTGDGRDDLLGLEYDGSLWFLAARRAGGFEEPRQLEGPGSFVATSAADLDGDGRTDLLGNTRPEELASIRRARAGGGFGPVEILPGARRSRSLAAGDLNGDGHVDVVAADLDSARVLLHSLAGDGTWDVPISLPIPSPAWVVRAEEYDGDGQVDLMVQFASNRFLGFPGGARFAEAPADTHQVDVGLNLDGEQCVVRDMDGDSRPELVFSSSYNRGLYICRQETPGNWVIDSQRVPPPESSLGSLAVADLDGDDWPDAALIAQSGAYLWAFDNDRAGGFREPRPILLPSRGRRMVVGSWFSDNDEIAVSTSNGLLAVVGHDPDVPPVSKTILHRARRDEASVVPADLNGDGHLDLVLGVIDYYETGTIWVAIGDGERRFTLVERPIGFPPQAIAVADVTGDGFPDLIAASGHRSAIWIFNGDGTGDFGVGRQIFGGDVSTDLFNKSLMAADLDDDGDIDLSLPGPYGELWVFTNPGNGLFGPPVVAPVRGFVSGLALADADDQPGSELYVLTYQPGLIQSFHLERNGQLHPLRVQESIGRSDRQTLADLDGDCIEDFLLQVGSSDRVTIQYGSGQGIFGPPVFERMGRELAWATAGDMDRDGRDDLVAYASEPGILQVRRGAPGGLGDIEEFAVGGDLSEYVLADLDNDGMQDLIGTTFNSSDVLILWNEGDPVLPIVPPAPAHLQLVRVSPNPGRGQVQMDLAGLSPGKPIHLEVFDVGGRLVSSHGPIATSSDRLCLRWNGRREDGSLVASGVYTLRVRTAGEQVITRVTILR